MCNLARREWCVAFAALVAMSALSMAVDVWALGFVVQTGWIALACERAHNLGRVQTESRLRREGMRCGQNPAAMIGHECRLPADGHTMHRCAHGDCSWGHY